MQELAPIAFVADDGDIRINFGMFAGREATDAEIDDLARTLLEEVRDVTIVAERHFVMDRQMEASVHQIRVESGSGDPRPLLALCADWAETRIAERHADL